MAVCFPLKYLLIINYPLEFSKPYGDQNYFDHPKFKITGCVFLLDSIRPSLLHKTEIRWINNKINKGVSAVPTIQTITWKKDGAVFANATDANNERLALASADDLQALEQAKAEVILSPEILEWNQDSHELTIIREISSPTEWEERINNHPLVGPVIHRIWDKVREMGWTQYPPNILDLTH